MRAPMRSCREMWEWFMIVLFSLGDRCVYVLGTWDQRPARDTALEFQELVEL